MMRLLRLSVRIFVTMGVVALGSTVWAQMDPEKALVGTWEGTVAMPRDNGRRIIIRSVKPTENGWVAEGFYATSETKGRGQRMTFDVSRQDQDIIVEFVTNKSNPGKLKLVSDRKMEGTLNVVLTGRTSDRALILEKLD